MFDIYAKYIPQPVDIKSQHSVYDNYDILEEIGTGAFGVVHRCREIKTGHVFAAKFIPITHAMEKASLLPTLLSKSSYFFFRHASFIMFFVDTRVHDIDNYVS